MNIRRMLVRGAIRSTFYRMSAIYWRARTFGRISGTSFRIIHPERLIVSRHGRLEIGQGTVIDFGARLIVHGYLRLGERVYVGRDAVISMAESVSIGAGTRIAERVSMKGTMRGLATGGPTKSALAQLKLERTAGSVQTLF
jgi:carbonic anhydrase/acetyltransferase-like protein (isoleucine patch superfamily)